jgi:hypothetical protein
MQRMWSSDSVSEELPLLVSEVPQQAINPPFIAQCLFFHYSGRYPLIEYIPM